VGRCFFTFFGVGVATGVADSSGVLAATSGALISAVAGFSCLLEQLITIKANAAMVEAATTSGRCRRNQLIMRPDFDDLD
jgi:phosphotransferase system  glucose/maltose/N-acetylglucosamine-specific IIC component